MNEKKIAILKYLYERGGTATYKNITNFFNYYGEYAMPEISYLQGLIQIPKGYGLNKDDKITITIIGIDVLHRWKKLQITC